MKFLSIISVVILLTSSCNSNVKIKDKTISLDTTKWSKAEESITFLFPKEFTLKRSSLNEGIQFKINQPGNNYDNGWMEIYELKNTQNVSFATFIYSAQEFYQNYIGKEGDPRVYNNVKDEFHGMPAQRIELNVKTVNGDVLTTCLLIDASSHFYLINYTAEKEDVQEKGLINLVLNSIKIEEKKFFKEAKVIKKNKI